MIAKLKEELKVSQLEPKTDKVEEVKKRATFSVKKKDGIVLLKVERFMNRDGVIMDPIRLGFYFARIGSRHQHNKLTVTPSDAANAHAS